MGVVGFRRRKCDGAQVRRLRGHGRSDDWERKRALRLE